MSLPEDLILRAKEFCTRTGRTFSGAVRIGLERTLDEDESAASEGVS